MEYRERNWLARSNFPWESLIIPMKKYAIFVLLMAGILLLAACSEGTPQSTTTDTSATSSAADTATTTPSGIFTQAPSTGTTETSTTSTAPPVTTVQTSPVTLTLSIPTPSFDLRGLSEEQADAFYADAVFVGDSISMHWRNYVTKQRQSNPAFFSGAQFLTSGSLGAANSLWPINNESVHPLYQGQQMQLWDSIPKTGAKKVLIMFGLNDVALYGVDKTVENMHTLMGKIKENAPDVTFYIMSATYVQKGGEKGKLNSALLREFNEALIVYCTENQVPFINLADALADTDGNLKAIYCNDGYVHHTPAAHEVWTKVLRGFAASQLKP